MRARTCASTAVIAAVLFIAAVLLNLPAIAMTCGAFALIALLLRTRAVRR